MDRGWKSFEVHSRKSLYCCEQTVEGTFRAQKEKRKAVDSLREYLSNLNRCFCRHMDSEDHCDEVQVEMC